MKSTRTHLTILAINLIFLFLAACVQFNDSKEQISPGAPLKVIATTTIVGDIVKNIAGDAVHLYVLLPTGSDPHNFQPTPQDITKIADADLVFMNGIGLEEFLEPLLENAGGAEKAVNLSAGISLLKTGYPENQDDEHAIYDPHVWMDPNNVMVWVKNIESTLTNLDPKNTALYRKNAENYMLSLSEVDQEILDRLALIPDSQRQLVTDHLVFGYFTNRYGFNQVGTIVPGYSTMAEPSAQEIAELEDKIRDLNAKVILVGNTINPSLAEQIAQDTGTQLVFVFTGSLTEQDGLAGNYLDFIRFNANEIISAAK